MNAEQPTTNPIDGYDCASSSSYPTGLQNFRYDGFPKWFTGKERDTESGLDYFGARYYGSALGRFISPDEPFADQRPSDPQSWNLYSYVRNNPLRFFDTDGREVKENREIVHYQVSGSNAQEALSAANAHFSGDFAGQTTPSIHVSYSFSSDSASTTSGATVTDTITSDTVTLNQKIELPDWTGRNKASADDQKTWDSAVSTLMGHEEGHADINRQGADNLDKSLPGTKASGAGPDAQAAGKSAEQNLGGKVQDKIRTSLSDTEKNNASYDSRTDHGRKQNQ